MSPLIVADESVDFAIIRLLRDNNFSVIAIVEGYQGWSDKEVLELAFKSSAYLITEDKDFGELTYRFKKPNYGIMLIRMMSETSDYKADAVLQILQQYSDQILMAFTVLERDKLRIKSL